VAELADALDLGIFHRHFRKWARSWKFDIQKMSAISKKEQLNLHYLGGSGRKATPSQQNGSYRPGKSLFD
jgi:hypothetical protein